MSLSIPSDVIKDARGLKSKSMTARDRGDFNIAESLIVQAEVRLTSALSDLRETRKALSESDDLSNPGKLEVDVAEQLGHILGSKGGIFRRWKRYEDSVSAYDAGYEQEAWVLSQGRENSYCLVQRLVARVLVSKAAGPEAGYVKSLPLHASLVEAQTEVARQRGPEGHRADDEYAAADAALIGLLLGTADWLQVLGSFVHASPRPSEYSVAATLEVVNDLLGAMIGDARPVSALSERLAQAAQMLASSSTQ
jgi:hypothetical protein